MCGAMLGKVKMLICLNHTQSPNVALSRITLHGEKEDP
jgi:hypothetical protein